MINEAKLPPENRDELIQIIHALQNNFAEQKNQFQEKENQSQEEIKLKEVTIASQRQFIEYLHEQIKLLKHGKFGASSETFIDADLQGRLFDELAEPFSEKEIEEAEESITVAEHARKRGRKALPKD